MLQDSPDSLLLALVQPLAVVGRGEERNVRDALEYIEAAAERGADLVVFPETYPGPWSMPRAFDPVPAMVEAAARHELWVCFGTLEPVDGDERRAYNVLALAGPDGGEPAVYRRTHPPGPWIYNACAPWDFEYVAGDELPVFELDKAVVGMAMCSEVYVPEVSRALAVAGAEVLILPAGTDKRNLRTTWRELIWARAIENLATVITTQNLLQPDETGMAMVAAPESVVFETGARGLFTVEIDLARPRELRARRDGEGSGTAEATKPGLLSQWRRPELYSGMLQESRTV